LYHTKTADMSFSIPDVGQPFSVSFDRYDTTFDGVIISIDPDPNEIDRKYKVQITNKADYDYNGNPYPQPDCVVEVEKKWFDPETGRKIKLLVN